MNLKTYKFRIDSASFTAKPDHRGRITIPCSIRKRMDVRCESVILVDIKRGDKYDR